MQIKTTQTKNRRSVVNLPYDRLLEFAKGLCLESGIDLPKGDWELRVGHSLVSLLPPDSHPADLVLHESDTQQETIPAKPK